MIRYEYEEELFSDHKMPIARNSDTHPIVGHHQPPHHHLSSEPFFPDADWLNADASVSHQIDEFAQHFNADVFNELDIEGVYDDLQTVSHVEHHFNDSLFDSHNSSYYANTTVDEEQLQNENNMSGVPFHDYYPQQRQEIQPLRSRDLNIPAQSTSSRQDRKKSTVKKQAKPASQRRPIGEFPTKNGFKKPLFSYSCLIGLALRNSESGELTVAEIYRFLCEHFPFFREAPSGWKNSVRHNLSLNKCFQKVEITVPDAQGRRSCLWRINPAKIDRMASEINKWRERCTPTIALAMDNPNDLEEIVNGQKGMPPADDLYMGMSGHDDDMEFNSRSKERVVYISRVQDLNKYESNRPKSIESRPPQYHSVPGHSKYIVRQPLRSLKQEEEYYGDENTPSSSSMPSTHALLQNRPHASSSIHERAVRNLESLLERKKHATVHPRDGPSTSSVEIEDQENVAPPQHEAQSRQLEYSPALNPLTTRPVLKPLAIRLHQRPHAHSTSDSPAPFGSVRPNSAQ